MSLLIHPSAAEGPMWESLRAVSSERLGPAYVALRPEMLQILRGLRLRGRGAQRQRARPATSLSPKKRHEQPQHRRHSRNRRVFPRTIGDRLLGSETREKR